MLRIRIQWVGMLFAVGSIGLLAADAPPRFQPPTTASVWGDRAKQTRERLTSLLDLPSLDTLVMKVEEVEAPLKGFPDASRAQRISLSTPSGFLARATLFPARSGSLDGPVVVYLANGSDQTFATGIGGRVLREELQLLDYRVLLVDGSVGEPLRLGSSVLANQLRADATVLHWFRSKQKSRQSFAVVATNESGIRALWLMALNPEIVCGSVIGGATRFADSIKQQKLQPSAWIKRLWEIGDTELIAALCAPRKLEIFVGDRDPNSPAAGVAQIESAARSVCQLIGGRGEFHVTRYGRFGDDYGLLSWDATLEILDKKFRPQGPTPLGHEPEREPEIDETYTNPAEFGIAGWQAEMSQRSTTWSWNDGVIACKPGPFEYGWLRCPIPVDDFILSVEWKIPEKGNAGIFIRAKPVGWFFPPSALNKLRVGALGRDWPSRTGLELQCSDDKGVTNKYTTGSLYRHAAPSANPSKPIGEWNRTTVRCRGPRIEVWVNGQQIVDADVRNYPLSLRQPPLRGYFGLQNHGAPAEFRNIRYRALAPDASAN